MSTKRNPQADARAALAADAIRIHFRERLARIGAPRMAILFSTGLNRHVEWNTPTDVGEDEGLPYDKIPGFEALAELGTVEGHGRRLHLDSLEMDVPVWWLEGRLHLNENPFNPGPVHAMVRLQIDMLAALGVEVLIVTSMVGTTTQTLRVGQIGVVGKFLNSGGDTFTGCAGEFPKLDGALDPGLREIALACSEGFMAVPVTHFFVHGPSIETDGQKDLFASWGAHVVGMSQQPEADAAARWEDLQMLGLAYIANGYEHSHQGVIEVANEWGPVWMKHLRATATSIAKRRLFDTRTR